MTTTKTSGEGVHPLCTPTEMESSADVPAGRLHSAPWVGTEDFDPLNELAGYAVSTQRVPVDVVWNEAGGFPQIGASKMQCLLLLASQAASEPHGLHPLSPQLATKPQ
ncbi:hypothetical protein Y032_0401g779 [Ancylostoma ceylanicum]|uniref:Uncharacterized protein n=1 Tax=Ancylostoma ceylanicum TaxID=53326 RepID=A0A016X2K3_9BILA|nr:hypothetical protein Y032_0401g779 [Ancylostoma ceylanicum]